MANIGKLVIVATCIAVGAFVAMRLFSRSTTSELGDVQPSNPKALVRIMPHKILMAASAAGLCFSGAPQYGPHTGPADIYIYANQIALHYRRDHPNGFDYPIGSKFVKEKYAIGSEHPEVATIMERRGVKGDVSDWTFSIKPLANEISLAPTSQESCAGCHAEYKPTGYVSSESEAALRKYLKIE